MTRRIIYFFLKTTQFIIAITKIMAGYICLDFTNAFQIASQRYQ
ncbi:hypothetical protein GCWU000324_02615 [Kingella oralis ATCC 51147]|uniref:Uncharacterized protein n=1 Tax=Kingella oralis ATCC 51147 TaxID=629741 RepID=C4GLP4_9NEIS|nr:hypothetical protein GCWU000324_02615 [Kingella oralis ATCC 51147]